MKFDLTKVKYSQNDINAGITVPSRLTEELAYFLGFHVGDGYMNIKKRGSTVDYHLLYGGHQINEYQWYVEQIQPLIKKLFNKDLKVTKTANRIVHLGFRSKAVVTFLHDCCGLPYSPKKETGVLRIIQQSDKNIKCHFLRGLADTDFSLFFRKGGKYPVINHTTYSKKLHESLQLLLTDLDIHFYSFFRFREQNGRMNDSYELSIYGTENLAKWMSTVGFSSYNTVTRHLVWKETGYLPLKTNIHDRIKILKGRGISFPPPSTP